MNTQQVWTSSRSVSFARWLTRAVSLVGLGAFAACGASGGAAAPAGYASGAGAVGSFCNPKFANEGCHILTTAGKPTYNRMKCTADATNDQAGKWELIDACPESCSEKAEPAGQSKQVATCIAFPTAPQNDTTGSDAGVQDSSSTDGTIAKDGTTADTVDPKAAVACIKSKCASEYQACLANAECKTIFACVEACKDDTCSKGCIGKQPSEQAFAVILAVSACGQEKGCTPKPGPKCGNAQCESGESESSCPADCKPEGKCGNGTCDEGESTTCPNDCKTSPKCGNSVCESGESPTTCPSDCKTTTKCGNGVCDLGETSSSCPGDCPAPPKCGNGTCDSGESPSTCPVDCKTTTTAKCGDLTCGSGESQTNCVVDCDPKFKASAQCVKSQCTSQWNGCLDDTMCAFFIKCAANCKCNEACVKSCGSDFGPNPSKPVQDFFTCASTVDCADPCQGTSACGNGTCDSGETPTSCPVDCKTTTKCGNGICDSGESPSTCPSDCKTAAKCGNGTCDTGETATSCPSDCKPPVSGSCKDKCGGQGTGSCYCDADCAKFGDCCPDIKQFCPAP